MSRRTMLWSAAFAAAAVSTTPALAGKGGNGGSSGGATSSIAIATVDGAGVTAAAAMPSPSLGDVVRFATNVEPLSGSEYAMVAVSCYQDVNGDGAVDTNLMGPDIVYSWLDKPAADYTLGGYSSIWTQRGGGAAVCRADLDAYSWKGGRETIRVLASTGDWSAQG
jgi:hypothetical protein